MDSIRNIAFDFGGVFVKITLQGCVDAFRALGFEDIEEYLNPYRQKGIFGDIEEGKITDEDFRRLVSGHVGHEVSWDDCQQGWLGFMAGIVPSNLQTVHRLREQGYRVALVSNTNPFIASWFRSSRLDGHGHGMGYYIPQDHQYLSFEQRCMKPGHEIFEKMLRHEGFAPGETLFVDDGAANLSAAEALGLHTFRPVNGEEWGSRLERLLTAP